MTYLRPELNAVEEALEAICGTPKEIPLIVEWIDPNNLGSLPAYEVDE